MKKMSIRTFMVTAALGGMLWVILVMTVTWTDGTQYFATSLQYSRKMGIVSQFKLKSSVTTDNYFRDVSLKLQQLQDKLKASADDFSDDAEPAERGSELEYLMDETSSPNKSEPIDGPTERVDGSTGRVDRPTERADGSTGRVDRPTERADGLPVLPVLVIACNRVSVKRCLNKLAAYRPNVEIFPIIISQDCDDKPTRDVINKFVDLNINVYFVAQPNQTEVGWEVPRRLRGYHKIARHYKFALTHVLDVLGYERVIIVEDDLDIAPDFFEYFLGTYQLLQKDPTLWCISAWNDNGKASAIDLAAPELLHRTDFFPGLGWMLTSKHWRRFRDKWPNAFFDDWLRQSAQRESYSCIRPEISRTYTFGEHGASYGMYFRRHLQLIVLNNEFVNFTELDLSYLMKDNYDKWQSEAVTSASPVSVSNLNKPRTLPPGDLKVTYDSAESFANIARTLHLMEDVKEGMPRLAYNGVVSCYFSRHRIYVTPKT